MTLLQLGQFRRYTVPYHANVTVLDLKDAMLMIGFASRSIYILPRKMGNEFFFKGGWEQHRRRRQLQDKNKRQSRVSETEKI